MTSLSLYEIARVLQALVYSSPFYKNKNPLQHSTVTRLSQQIAVGGLLTAFCKMTANYS